MNDRDRALLEKFCEHLEVAELTGLAMELRDHFDTFFRSPQYAALATQTTPQDEESLSESEMAELRQVIREGIREGLAPLKGATKAWREWARSAGGAEWDKVDDIERELGRGEDDEPPCGEKP